MSQDDFWLSNGKYGGRLVLHAEERLSAVSMASSISIDVLDAVIGDDSLVSSLTVRALIDDLKHERFGREYSEERQCIAANTVDDFHLAWPSMRQSMRENYLVSLVSSLENYVMSLLVEFPPLGTIQNSKLPPNDNDPELDWQKADSAYKKAVKTEKSASRAWVSLCRQSSIPENVKNAVLKWGNDEISARMVEEMVLVRNVIVHRGGVVSDRLASRLALRGAPHVKTVAVSKECMGHYERAYWGFVVSVTPSL